MENKNVAVLGATNDHTKYAFKTQQLLRVKGYNPIPINPNEETVVNRKSYASLRDVPEPIDTITVYVNPKLSTQLTADILAVKPRRIIFNPTTENPELEQAAKEHGIQVIHACTIVMLTSETF